MLHFKCIFILVLLAYVSHIKCDYYSSISGLEQLLFTEGELIGVLEEYIQIAELKNEFMKRFIENVQKELTIAEEDVVDYYENPINAFKTIKRLTRDWHDAYKYEPDMDNVEVAVKETNLIKTPKDLSNYQEPVLDDLIGAAKGIARLQSMYELDTAELANGTIMGRQYSLEMTPSDCVMMGMGMLNATKYDLAISWFLEGRARLHNDLQNINYTAAWNSATLQEEGILDQLAEAALKNGNTKLAYIITTEMLEKNPANPKALEARKLIVQQLNEERSLVKPASFKADPELPSVQELYEKTCRGELKQTPAEQRDLRCQYQHNDVPFCLIAPFKVEELSLDPFVAFYHEVIYESEIENVLNATERHIIRSQVGTSGDPQVSDIRTSKQAWLNYDEHKFMFPIAQRLTDITALNMATAEFMQVANYGIGGHYGPHYDFSESAEDAFHGRGNRLLTALFYINDVELGGATAFPFLRLAVPPVRRSLVLWYNVHESLELDFRTKHAGCPVLKGSKWICNEWYHLGQQELHFPCSLQQVGYKSVQYKSRV